MRGLLEDMSRQPRPLGRAVWRRPKFRALAAEAILRFEFNSSISARSGWRVFRLKAPAKLLHAFRAGEERKAVLRGRRPIRASWDCGLQCPRRDLSSLEQPREAIAWADGKRLLSRLSLYRLEPYARRLVIEQLEAGGFEHGDDCVQLPRRKRLFFPPRSREPCRLARRLGCLSRIASNQREPERLGMLPV